VPQGKCGISKDEKRILLFPEFKLYIIHSVEQLDNVSRLQTCFLG